MFVCVCMCALMCVSVCMHACVCVYECVFVCVCTHVCACLCIRGQLCSHSLSLPCRIRIQGSNLGQVSYLASTVNLTQT